MGLLTGNVQKISDGRRRDYEMFIRLIFIRSNINLKRRFQKGISIFYIMFIMVYVCGNIFLCWMSKY